MKLRLYGVFPHDPLPTLSDMPLLKCLSVQRGSHYRHGLFETLGIASQQLQLLCFTGNQAEVSWLRKFNACHLTIMSITFRTGFTELWEFLPQCVAMTELMCDYLGDGDLPTTSIHIPSLSSLSV